ncbi:MAG: protein-disulfide reductase DsbD [Rhodanobacteraceae bacterium]
MFLKSPGRWALGLLLAAVIGPALVHAQDDGLLEVTDAFHLTASIPESGSIQLTWKIADDYYLYRGRVAARSLDDSLQLGALQLPDGKKEHDEYLGDVEIYHHQLKATLPYALAAGHQGPIRVAIRFQGCHEVAPRICYPPYTQTLSLMPPVETATDAPPAGSAGMGGLSDALGKLGGSRSPQGPVDAGPMPPEQAFHFEAIADSPTAVLARFTMPDGYYLYRDKSRIELVSGDGITLGKAQWPKGVQHDDEHFGTTEVFFGEADIRIPLKRDSGKPQTMVLKAVFQGCQDGGICYPLMTRQISLDLPAASSAQLTAGNAEVAGTSAQSDNASSGQSEEQRLASSLSGPRRWLALLFFFGGGLLLAFTPCVLPMVPILSGLIAGAGKNISTGRAFVLSLTYVLATAVVFTIAGVLAGMAGANLQAALQTPWVLWLFAAVFVLLSLSMFGFYELQLPTALQNRLTRVSNKQRPGSLTGVAIMGVLSALIVGPCVAPPLAAAVLYIAKQHDPVFGGLALLSLSLGMGVPLIIFGTAAGNLLPRAGAWMNTVKAVFGVTFLGLAIWMLTRILDPAWIMLMSGALLVACAVYMGALERIAEGASGWRRLWKALGLIALIIGAAELLGAAAGSRDPLQPLGNLVSGTSTQASTHLDFRTVTTVDDLDRALSQASLAGKPVMLDFYADWCVSCKEMERFTYSKPGVQQALAGYVLLKADVTANDDDARAMLKRFSLYGPPATILFDSSGRELRALRLIGFEDAAKFRQRVKQADKQTS